MWKCLAILFYMSFASFAIDVTVNVDQRYQTIDGFGFFGPMDVWWSSGPFTTQAWLDLVIDDLGITIWRNEYYSEESNQDANWAKQKAAVVAIKQKADASNVPLKMFYSVWSPPSAMKCANDNGCWGSPTTQPWAEGIKGGGTLCESEHAPFAEWLKAGIKKYKDEGIDLYAISFQNEPLFCQFYNSGFYSYDYYAEVLGAIAPTIKAAYPGVKFLGAEHMLSANMNNGNSQFDWIYEANMLRNGSAQHMDIWAYHGYSDGVNAVPSSEMAQLWGLVKTKLAPTSKPLWMTETSGYDDSWGPGGALELAAAIHAGLQFGNMAGWVYWYGAGDLINSAKTGLTKRGAASKQFYRYIRPGAQRVELGGFTDNELVMTAYKDDARGTFVVLAINTGSADKQVNLTGTGLPDNFTLFRTSAQEDCAEIGTMAKGSVTLKAMSLNTLVSGNVYEDPSQVGTINRARAVAASRKAGSSIICTLDGKRVQSASPANMRASGVYRISQFDKNGNLITGKLQPTIR